MPFAIIEMFASLFLLLTIITQILVPLVYNEPIFPILDGRWRGARKDLSDAMDELSYQEFHTELEKLLHELETEKKTEETKNGKSDQSESK